jgi:choline dehydrogenase-like flavoprotein
VRPTDDFRSLKTALDDPAAYFLGRKFESLILPGHDGEYYGFPPSKSFVFDPAGGFDRRADGFAPLLSFAEGGLAEAWTGGCYPFTDRELGDYPFGYRELAPYYAQVAQRIGISGEDDDLSRFFPLHEGLMGPLDLDEHSRTLLEAYRKRKERLNSRHRCYVGRARVATLSRDHRGRKACDYLGRCLWGCPSDSLYTPSVTLKECRAHERFEYRDGLRVDHFRCSSSGRIDKLVAHSTDGARRHEIDVGTLVLAAGTLSSSKILLDSIYRDSGQIVELGGLMDNRQVLMPFVNLSMIGRPFDPRTYQYHQLAVALEADDPRDHVHGLVTTLKTAMIHPIVASIPTSIGAALGMFRSVHAALGLLNLNFADRRREENRVCVEPCGANQATRLVIQYRPEPNEGRRIARITKTFRRILWSLGCVAPRAMTHVRPMGASVHYAGTVPMGPPQATMTTDANCRSRQFENLYFVDGTTLPGLPAKNLTFTLMANAARVADVAF